MKKNYKQKNKGFTLVEVLVATFIFTSIMMVSISSLLATMSASKKARSLRVAMDNVNFAMETMARSIRMGNYYYCDNNVDLAMTELNKKNTIDCSMKEQIAFLVDEDDTTKTKYYKDGTSLSRVEVGENNGVPITSSEVKVEILKFTVKDSATNDNKQPSVYVIMNGSVTVRGEDYPFALQTLASRRRYE